LLSWCSFGSFARSIARKEAFAMLVFSRRPLETVQAGPVKITVLSCQDGRCRLGFDADPSVPIDRGEVAERRADWRKDPENVEDRHDDRLEAIDAELRKEQADADELGVGKW
jgi:sRNA-binding carbon storage regulator CsrA